MFWGTVIKEGQPLKSQKVLESSEFAVLHLSSAIVDKASGKSTKLFAKLGKDSEVIIANLSEKNEQQNLDHYINCTQNVTLFVKGPSDVHLSGYFEPKGDDMDDDMFYGQEADEAEEDEDSEEDEKPAKSKAVEASLKQAKLNSARNAMAKPADDDDESDLEDDMLDDEEDLEDMDDLDLDAEEEESEEEMIPVHKKKESPKAPVVQDSEDDSDDIDD